MHKVFFGKSDLLFLCMLRPLSFDIHKQDSEIEAAKVPYVICVIVNLYLAK